MTFTQPVVTADVHDKNENKDKDNNYKVILKTGPPPKPKCGKMAVYNYSNPEDW